MLKKWRIALARKNVTDFGSTRFRSVYNILQLHAVKSVLKAHICTGSDDRLPCVAKFSSKKSPFLVGYLPFKATFRCKKW